MAVASGISAQMGWKAETVYGTPVTVDKFVPLRSESISDTYGRVMADDIIAGSQTMKQEQVRSGNKSFGGSIGMYLFNRNVAELFKMVLGGTVTTGAGPYTHTSTPGELTGDSMTLQVGRPDQSGTVRPATYKGVKVKSLSIACSAGEYATMDLDLFAQDVETNPATIPLATASYPASLRRFHADDLAVTLGGTSLCVRNFELSITNALDDTRRCVGSPLAKEPVRNGLIEVAGSLEIEWTDLTHYNRVKDLTYADLVATFTKSPDSLAITVDAQIDEASMPVAGRGVVYQTLTFMGVGASTDADTITVVQVNADSAA